MCLCNHMSYFTVIEDMNNQAAVVIVTPFIFSFLENFKDYSALAISSYVLFIFLILSIYSRGKDLVDWKILYKMNESEDKNLEILDIDNQNIQVIEKDEDTIKNK